jgi:hypothetical protein
MMQHPRIVDQAVDGFWKFFTPEPWEANYMLELPHPCSSGAVTIKRQCRDPAGHGLELHDPESFIAAIGRQNQKM